MKTTEKERNAKIELLIEFLKTKSTFNINEICSTLEISKTMPYVLKQHGYLTKTNTGQFVSTDLIDILTIDKYKKLMTDYHKICNNKAKEKKRSKKVITITDFLNSKKNNNESIKDLANKIHEILKPYLN